MANESQTTPGNSHSEATCFVCLCGSDPNDPGDQKQWLRCGHWLHEECCQEYCAAHSLNKHAESDRDKIKCGLCKKTGLEVLEATNLMLAETVAGNCFHRERL